MGLIGQSRMSNKNDKTCSSLSDFLMPITSKTCTPSIGTGLRDLFSVSWKKPDVRAGDADCKQNFFIFQSATALKLFIYIFYTKYAIRDQIHAASWTLNTLKYIKAMLCAPSIPQNVKKRKKSSPNVVIHFEWMLNHLTNHGCKISNI